MTNAPNTALIDTPEGFRPPPERGREPPPRRPASRLWAIPWLATSVALSVGGFHYLAPDVSWPLTIGNVLLPWIAAGSIVSVLAALVGRRGILILFAIPGAVVTSVPVSEEIWPRDPAYGEGAPLRLLTANLYLDNIAHAGTIAGLLGADADVLCLQEVTHAWARSLEDKSVTEVYPYRYVVPEDSPFGIALLSKVPLEGVGSYELAGTPQLRGVADVEGTPLEVHCIHLMPPITPALHAIHQRAGEELLGVLAARGADAGPITLAGDFNSTPYNGLHRRLVENLYDAWEWAGDGWGYTAPAKVALMPSMRIDHVYAGGGVRPVDAELLPADGSDHHPLVVYLAVPRP